MAVSGGRGGGGRTVADGPFGAVGRGVHAEGGAVAQGGLVEGRVAEAASRYVNGAQGRAGVRDFRQSRQGIGQVVKIVWGETEIESGVRCWEEAY